MTPAIASLISRMRSKNNAGEGQYRSYRELSEVSPVRTDQHAEAVPSQPVSVASGMSPPPSGSHKQAVGNSTPTSLPHPSDGQPAGSNAVVPPGSQGSTPSTDNRMATDSKQAVPSGASGGNQDSHESTADGNVLGMFMPLGEEDASVSAIAAVLEDVDIGGLVEFAEKVSGELRT